MSNTPSWAQLCATGGSSSGVCPNQGSKVWGGGLVWDAADNYVLHFGGSTGQTGTTKQETYTWANGAWAKLTPGTQPSARANFTMVYDTADSYVFLWGGYTSAGAVVADNYKWTGGNWVVVSPATSPPGRSGMCGVYVPLVSGHGGYVLMFGGRYTDNSNGAGAYPNDTWKYVGGAWTNITTNVGPTPTGRTGAACAYDTADNYVLWFGGVGAAGAYTNDVWKFDPAQGTTGKWVQITTNGAAGVPSARAYAEMDYNTYAGKVILTEGARGTIGAWAPIPSDTWSYVGGTWKNQTALYGGITPVAQMGATVATVTAYGYSMYYGGLKSAGGTQNGSYELGNVLTSQGTASNPGELAANTQINFWNNVTGGSGTYTYTYHGLPTGCATTNATHFTCTPTTAGVYMVNCTTVDTGGQKTDSSQIKVVVDSVLSVSGSLNIGSYIYSPPSYFFGGDVWSNLTAGQGPGAISNDLNLTPIRTLHFYGDFDKDNLSAGYQGQSYGSQGTALTYNTYNLSNYVSLCKDLHCVPWLSIPSQTNDSGATVAAVKQYEQRWGFVPAYYSMGVEISAWNHYNIPYTSWNGSQSSTPTGVQYAAQLNHMIPLIQAIDPNVKYVAQFIAGTVTNGSLAQWIQNISKSVCGKISAIALDAYPSQGNGFGNVNLATFYNNLSVVTNRINTVYGQEALGSGTCPQIPMWFGEQNSANGGSSWSPYMQSYPNVPWIASAIIQSFQGKVGVYNSWSLTETQNLGGGNGGSFSMINVTSGATKPLYGLYSSILSHLSYANIYNAPTTTTMKGVYSIVGNGPGNSVLVDNTNTTVSLVFTPTNFPTAEGVTAYTDNQTAGTSAKVYGAGTVPATFTVPPLGVLLLNQGTGTVIGSTNPGGAPIASPTNLTVTSTGFSSVSLSWTNPANGSFTNVTVYWGPSCTSWASSAVLGPANSYTVTGLNPISRYCFAVSDSAPGQGNSPLSATVTATTLPTPPPIPGFPIDSWKVIGGVLAISGFGAMIYPSSRRWLGLLLFFAGMIMVAFL